MDQIILLWKPILVSAAFVFIASNILWMVLPIHKKDYKKLGEREDGVMSAVRGLPGGLYMFPWCAGGGAGKDEAAAPGAKEKMEKGPWGLITVQPSRCSMGVSIGAWFINILLVSAVVGYICGHTLSTGSPYLAVFRVAGTLAFLGYAGGILPQHAWRGLPWSHFPGCIFDALVYTGLTAGTFAWLWPSMAK